MTPQGQVTPPSQPPSWFSRNWMWLVAVFVVGPMICCGSCAVLGLVADDGASTSPIVRVTDLPSARVDCGEPGPGGVDCVLKRTDGAAALNACWDLDITCNNGGVMSGHGCGGLDANVPTATINIPAADFANQEGCDVPKQGAVKNLQITAR